MKRYLLTTTTIAAVAAFVSFAAPASAQPAGYDDAMKQAEQYLGGAGTGGVPQGSVPAIPEGVPGAAPGGVPRSIPSVPPGAVPRGMPGVPAGVPGMGGAPGAPAATPDPPIALSSGDVTSFIATAEQLDEIGIDTSDGDETVDSIAANAEARRVLEANGYTPERFQSVGYSIGMAMAGLEAKAQGTDLAAERVKREQEMVKLKESLPPEQYEMMRGTLGAADGMLLHIENQPPGNLTVVEEHRAQIEAVLEKSEE